MSIVFVGLTTIDHTQMVDRLPAPDEKIVAKTSRIDVGGPAANAARTAQKLGCQVKLVTALGTGPLASLARSLLGGIEIFDIAGSAHEPPISSIMLQPDGNRAVVSTNATSLVNPQLPSADIAADANVILHDGHLLDASAVFAELSDAVQILDGGSWKPGLEKLLPNIDVAVVSGNFTFPDSAPENSLADLAGIGIGQLARTKGGDPVEVVTASDHGEYGHGEYGHEEYSVEPVEAVDTNGAGDVLHGALAAYLSQGDDFRSALQKAMQLATESVKYHGVLGWAEQK